MPEAQKLVAGELRSLVERVERLTEERASIATDIADVYKEARGLGYDTKAIKEIVKKRSKDKSEVEEFEAILELYETALGMRIADEGDDEPAPRAPAPARTTNDLTVRIETDRGSSGEMPLSTFNKIADGSRTEAGRAVIASAMHQVKHGADAEVPFA